MVMPELNQQMGVSLKEGHENLLTSPLYWRPCNACSND